MTSRFRARYDKWLWLVLVGVVVIPIARAGFFVATGHLTGVLAMLVIAGVVVVLLWCLLPRAYELWPDRIRIVFGWQLGWSIPLNGIEEIEPTPGVFALVSWRARFATSVKTTVRIRRTRVT